MILLDIILQTIPQSTKSDTNWFDFFVKSAGVVGGLTAAFKAVSEMRQSRKQREREFRWKQSNAAKSLIDEMQKNQLAQDASIMLDWNGNSYTAPDEQIFIITHQDVINGLRTKNLTFSSQEKYIRDCFDSFLNYFEFMEQSLQIELFQLKDILYPIEYYINSAKNAGILPYLEIYMKEYSFSNSILLINRILNK
jgi:hypothetical protein